METTASQYFGAMVDEYDSLIRRAVPRYDEMIDRTVEYMTAEASSILELGCGTGNLTLAVAARYPQAELTLVDDSREMLQGTQSRLDPDREVTLLRARFETVELPPASFDLATSCIALHHVVDKRALFARLHAALKPGGMLVFSDQMAGRTDANHRINWDHMLAFWREPGHCTNEESQSLVEHAEAHDHYASIVEQIHLLEDVGFQDVDCVWRNWMWGVVTARK